MHKIQCLGKEAQQKLQEIASDPFEKIIVSSICQVCKKLLNTRLFVKNDDVSKSKLNIDSIWNKHKIIHASNLLQDEDCKVTFSVAIPKLAVIVPEVIIPEVIVPEVIVTEEENNKPRTLVFSVNSSMDICVSRKNPVYETLLEKIGETPQYISPLPFFEMQEVPVVDDCVDGHKITERYLKFKKAKYFRLPKFKMTLYSSSKEMPFTDLIFTLQRFKFGSIAIIDYLHEETNNFDSFRIDVGIIFFETVNNFNKSFSQFCKDKKISFKEIENDSYAVRMTIYSIDKVSLQ